MASTQNHDIPVDETDALGLLQSIYRSPGVSLSVRMRAAIAALPFERPKLAVVATTTSEDLAERLERAKAVSMKVINERPVQIEAQPEPVNEAQDVSSEHMGKPFAMLRRT